MGPRRPYREDFGLESLPEQQDGSPRHVRRRVGLWYRRVARAFRGQRLRPIWIVAVYAYALFMLFRLGLLLLTMQLYPDAAWGHLHIRDLLWCFVLGFGFDSMAVGYMLLPMGVALAGCSAQWIRTQWFRRLITMYAAVASLYMLATEVVGAGFFLQYGARIDWRLPYYTQNMHEVWGFLFLEYYIWAWMLLILPIIYAFYRIYRAVFWKGHVTLLPGWRRVAFVAVVIGVFVLACRGGISSRPLNTSKAYYTANKVLVQLAMNNNITLYDGTRNILDDEAEEEKGRFDLPDAEHALPHARAMLWQSNDRPVPEPSNPLWRRTKTGQPLRKPNVVLIMMESMAGRHVGALGHPHSQTPNLDALCRRGLFFSHMYAVGAETSRGLVGTLCGYPDLSGRTVLDRPQAQGRFLTLPGILKRRGYQTVFLSCGMPSFDSMDLFFRADVDRFVGQNDINVPPTSSWGVADEYMYDKAVDVFDAYHAEGEAPFFGMILTISNHEPFTVPHGRVAMLPEDDEESRIINATRYADWALDQFFTKAASRDWFENTIFVLVADTGRQVEYDRARLIDAMSFRIPCLIYTPGRLRTGPLAEPRTVTTLGSQTDLAPTLLSLLGGEYEHCFLGRNILDVKKGEGFALLHQYDRLGFIRDGHLLVVPPRRQPPTLYRINHEDMTPVTEADRSSPRIQTMKRDMLSLYSSAWVLYKQGLYKTPHQAASSQADAP